MDFRPIVEYLSAVVLDLALVVLELLPSPPRFLLGETDLALYWPTVSGTVNLDLLTKSYGSPDGVKIDGRDFEETLTVPARTEVCCAGVVG